METKKIIKWIKEYNLFNEHITISTIFAKMNVGRDKHSVINFGTSGSGKSYSSIDLLEDLGTGTDIILDNNTTKRGLFDEVMSYPNYTFVLDECTAIMRDKGTQDMIKLLIEGKKISWIKKDSHEKTPEFTGNFIINTNIPLIDSLKDRCFVNKTMMNKKMAIEFVKYYLKRPVVKHDDEVLNYIKELIKTDDDIELSKQDLDYILALVEKQIEFGEEGLGYSRRIIIRMISYFKRVKKLFGKLDKEVKDFIEPFALVYIENKRTPTMFATILGDTKMDKIELIRAVAAETGYSERHARRIVDDEISKKRIKSFGREVFL